METRSNKRKQLASLSNPYAKTFAPRPRRRNRLNNYRASVIDLRARRVFSPASISDMKGNSEGAEATEKVVNIDLGVGGETEIAGEKGRGTDGNTEIDDKVVDFDLEVSQKDQIEIRVSCEDQLVQTTTGDGEISVKSNHNTEIDQENTSMDAGLCQRDCFVGEGERDEQDKSKVKLGVLAPCLRTKLYKNTSSFSYRRLLPYLTDMAKNNPNSRGINPCQKVDKSVEEKHPASLSASPVILTDGTHKNVLTNNHSFGDSNTSSIGPINIEIPNMRSPVCHLVEPTSLKTPKASVPSTNNSLVIKELSHLYGEIASPAPKDIPNALSKSLCPFVIPEPSSIKEGDELDKECCLNGNTEIESIDGEWIQSTPPDSDIFCKPGPVMIKDDAQESPSNNKTISDKSRCVGEGEKDRQPNSKSRLGVLVPCSRMKLYKTPGSFSYRRLLPFLKDLAKNDTDTVGSRPCQQNVEGAVDEGPHFSSLGSQGILENGTNKVLTNGHPFGGSDASPNLESTKTNSPTGSSNVDCSNLESCEGTPVVEPSIQEPSETSILSELDGSVLVEPLHMDVESSPQVRETNLLIKSSPSLLSEEAVNDCSILVQKSSTDVKSLGELCLNHDSSNTELFAPSEKPPVGILKRHRRGCRGICTCLNCASFRLHAERAFEFSRNQMDDTEEVALELMKELAYIRSLLEKSLDGAECHAGVQFQPVKEACLKAKRAEELAKNQLKQMSQELNAHCRTQSLQRPRVRFADNSERE